MKDLDRFDEHVWRKFFTFLIPDERNMTRQEVEAELLYLGIDTRPGWAKLQCALRQIEAAREARASLEDAKRRRPSFLEKINDIASVAGSLTKENLRQLIAEQFSGTSQTAFFRKLDSAASEDDLRSLFDDMSKLDALTKESDDANL